MPGYIAAALHKFQHDSPAKPEHTPHPYTQPVYHRGPQLAPAPDCSPKLNTDGVKHIQQIIAILLYYTHAVDPTMLMAINAISIPQVRATQKTAAAVTHLLNYADTHPGAIICYHASQMALYIHSAASFMLETEARSRAGGHFFMSKLSCNPSKPPTLDVALNGP
eukprot:243959-Ditylum_brightwellii.AAC.1